MNDWKPVTGLWMAITILCIGCGASAPAGRSPLSDASPSGETTPLKRIAVAANAEPDLHPFAAGGTGNMRAFVSAGLTAADERGARRPVLAEEVPTLENGLWTLLPEGRMETTWRIKGGAFWHDGAPFSADDAVFTFRLARDPGLAAFGNPVYSPIEDVVALSPDTLSITWKEPYIYADWLFGHPSHHPLPKHRLEDAYRFDKATFADLPFWTQEYVGTGPYRVRGWVPGVHVLLEAHREYVLGRPKIDEIEVKVIEDGSTRMANLLAGSIDLTITSLGSVDLGVELRDQWRAGTVTFNLASGQWIALYPQFIDPQPAAVADVRFRRALLHAIDRQEMADILVAGLSPVAHSIMIPNQPEYREIEGRIPRHEYDPRQATQMLEGLGYARGPDAVYLDTARRKLEVEVRSGPQDQAAKPAEAIAVYWERIGVTATAVRQSPQRAQDFEYQATFPAFNLRSYPNDDLGIRSLHSSRIRLPANNFRVSGVVNYSRYAVPEFDALVDRYTTTVPLPHRMQVLGQIVHHVADQLPIMGLYYNPEPTPVANRLVNVSRSLGPATQLAWNAHEWDLK